MDQFISQVYKKIDASSKKTVFVDRDGTINKEVHYLANPNQLKIIPGVIDGIKKLNKYDIAVIVISNQPVIARGLATLEDVRLINDTLVNLLDKEGAYINAIYFCPHHPERNHPDIPVHAMKYRIECECRKPKLAMFKKAIKDFNINLKSSFVVGDRTEDIKAGEDLGIQTILVETGFGGKDNKYPILPNYKCGNLLNAADIIINL